MKRRVLFHHRWSDRFDLATITVFPGPLGDGWPRGAVIEGKIPLSSTRFSIRETSQNQLSYLNENAAD
ncbi:hypothetical protein ACWNXI_06395 [Caldibacillus thermoamylovorans]